MTESRDTRAVEMEVDLDRTRTLRVDLNSLADIEEFVGLKFFGREGEEAKADFFADLSIKQFRGVLWALLRDDDPELTERDVGRFVHMGNIGTLSEAIGELFQRAMPEAPKDPLGRPAPARIEESAEAAAS